jgi:hypothetical protein
MHHPNTGTTRRAVLGAALASAATAAPQENAAPPAAVTRNDQILDSALRRQITDPASPDRGGFASTWGPASPHGSANAIMVYTASFLSRTSRFYHSSLVAERLRMAIDNLRRMQHESGFIDLLFTNFNSPPDTAFATNEAATAGFLLKREGQREFFGALEPFLRKAGDGLAVGGVHTPNHRWVVSSALAQLYVLFNEPAYLRRADQWLAEGIDIDPDGQYTERSPGIYNGVTNRALTILALKLNRPELLDPVRRNLESMLYMLHPDFEVATEFSHRQDKYARAEMHVYWLPVRLMAIRQHDGRLAALARHLDRSNTSLAHFLEYPEICQPLPASAPLPDAFERHFEHLGVVRYRRGKTSATFLSDNDVVFSLRHGEAAVSSVSFGAAWFGRALFHGQKLERTGRAFRTSQSLDWGYWQPFVPTRKIPAGAWDGLRPQRQRTEECFLDQSAELEQTARGFRLRVRSSRTDRVPVTIRIGVPREAKVEGIVPGPEGAKGLYLRNGYATITQGKDRIRVGPGRYGHCLTTMIKLPEAVSDSGFYITGLTPFDHSVEFELA